jgi:hypothetical protein
VISGLPFSDKKEYPKGTSLPSAHTSRYQAVVSPGKSIQAAIEAAPEYVVHSKLHRSMLRYKKTEKRFH